jgi:hypothetical protein
MSLQEAEEIPISIAISALDTGDCDNIADAARMYKVCYKKLRARRLGWDDYLALPEVTQ